MKQIAKTSSPQMILGNFHFQENFSWRPKNQKKNLGTNYILGTFESIILFASVVLLPKKPKLSEKGRRASGKFKGESGKRVLSEQI